MNARVRTVKNCGICRYLNLSDEALRDAGKGRCRGFDTPPPQPPAVAPAVKLDPIHHWSDPFCVMFTPSEKMSVRMAWILQIEQSRVQQT